LVDDKKLIAAGLFGNNALPYKRLLVIDAKDIAKVKELVDADCGFRCKYF
jgi:hypothetical protein